MANALSREIAFEELRMAEHLGGGGYGEVYKAQWKGTDVAVKIVSMEGQVNSDIRGKFKEEVRFLNQNSLNLFF